MRLTVNSDSQLSKAIGLLRSTFEEKKYFTLYIKTGKQRTASQNAISHSWYSQVAQETGEYTAGHVKCLCKYHVGLPIVRASDEEYNDKCVQFIDVLSYEHKIMAMEYMPVTSLMTTEQLSEYLVAVQFNYMRRNVILCFPEDYIQNMKKEET